MQDWIDFGEDFPLDAQKAIRCGVFMFRADHNLADDAFKVKALMVSKSHFDLWVTTPDDLRQAQRNIKAEEPSASKRVYEYLERKYAEWCARTGTRPTPPIFKEVFEGGPANLSDLLRNSPFAEATDLNLERAKDYPRPVDLG
jgi:hypothetical protein